MSKRKANAVAKDLRTPKYRMRSEKPQKGKGSFKRIKNADMVKAAKSGFYFEQNVCNFCVYFHV